MRQFVASSNPDKKGLIEVTGKDFRYFAQVLRLSAGDMLAVRLPSGELVNTTVAKIDENKRSVILQVCDVGRGPVIEHGRAAGKNQSDLSGKVEYFLFQFVAKGPKMDLIVRQAAECGVSKIIPVLGEYSQAGGAEKKNFRGPRFERIIKEARQQSGSPVSTEVVDPVSVEEACAMWKEISGAQDNAADGCEKAFGCVLYERSDKTKNLHAALSECKEIKKCAIICGAEGGISPEEIESFIAAGIVPVHFDTNILRCETAALYGMACVQSAVSEMEIWQKK